MVEEQNRRAGVRLATADDFDAIMALLRLMHAETALYSLDEPKVAKTVTDCITNGFVIGALSRNGEIVGTCGLTFGSHWYTSDVILMEIWFFLRAEDRPSGHAVRMIKFANSIGDEMGLDVFGGVLTTKETERKCAFFGRHMMPVGQMFLGGAALRKGAN